MTEDELHKHCCEYANDYPGEKRFMLIAIYETND